MVGAVNLDNEVLVREVEVNDAVVRRVEALLEAIAKAELCEAPAELVFGGGLLLLQPGDVDRVPLYSRKPVERAHAFF